MSCSNRAKRLGSLLESMEINIDSQENAVAILNGLPEQ